MKEVSNCKVYLLTFTLPPLLKYTLYTGMYAVFYLQVCNFQLDMLSFLINYELLICVSFVKIVLLICWA